jgi:hypothetical protein
MGAGPPLGRRLMASTAAGDLNPWPEQESNHDLLGSSHVAEPVEQPVEHQVGEDAANHDGRSAANVVCIAHATRAWNC